jgi:SNF family Na+-dependent transporter
MSESQKDGWGSRLGVILAVAGSAVGLGNFLRFPGQAADNGGGAFMIPYFCALLFLGIPIGWAEWTMGRYGGRKGFHSAPAIMGVVGKGPLFRYLGVAGVLIPLGVYFYYVFIESWCLGYFWKYLIGGIGVDPAAAMNDQTASASKFWEDFTGQHKDGELFESGHGGVLVFWLITMALNVWFVFRGLSKGIETFCKWAMPAMAVIALIVLARVLTLPPNEAHADQNVGTGLAFMWNPDFKALGKADTWLDAAGQIFFSLSVGFGVIINYASYMKRKDDVVLSGITASATNELFEVGFGGMITIPAAFIFMGATGIIGADGAARGSFGLGFTTLPVVFAQMPGGNLIGALWFFMLFLAAITSSLSMLQPTMAFVQEALGCSRGKATTLTALVATAGSVYCLWFTGGTVGWSTIDDWVGTFLIVVLALFQVIAFGWCFGVKRGLAEAHEGAQLRIPAFMAFVIKYLAPAYLLVVIVTFATGSLPQWWARAFDPEAKGYNPVAGYSLIMIAAVTIGLVVLTRIGVKRWRAAGLDVDGERPPDDEPLRPAVGGGSAVSGAAAGGGR